jgi:uncharacterized protein YjiS (DUF1127 family)
MNTSLIFQTGQVLSTQAAIKAMRARLGVLREEYRAWKVAQRHADVLRNLDARILHDIGMDDCKPAAVRKWPVPRHPYALALEAMMNDQSDCRPWPPR